MHAALVLLIHPHERRHWHSPGEQELQVRGQWLGNRQDLERAGSAAQGSARANGT